MDKVPIEQQLGFDQKSTDVIARQVVVERIRDRQPVRQIAGVERS